MSTYKTLNKTSLKEAETLLRLVIVPQLGDGAVLQICDPHGAELMRCHSGTLSDRSFEQHLAVAKKQNADLDRFPNVKSTWQLRNQVCPPGAGGIRTPLNDRFSISGFTDWHVNQNAALWLAITFARMKYIEACKIAADSGQVNNFKKLSSQLNAAYDRLPARVSYLE